MERLQVRADRAGRDLAEAEPDVVDDPLAIEGVGHRLAHLLLVEGGDARVELQPRDRREHFVAFGGHREMRQLVELARIAVRHAAEAGEVRRAPGRRCG